MSINSAIVGTFNKIPKRQNSHSYGWARTWSENLNISIDYNNEPHDRVYLLHGANFGGSLNFFSGFTDEIKESINNLMFSNEIISLDIDMPAYGEMLKKRNDVKDKAWCDALTEKLSSAKTLVSSDLDFDWLTVGDSHTAAYAPLNSCVVKRDGTTLFGQVKEDFAYLRQHINKKAWRGVTISLGNIDVRHHICRMDVDWKEMYNKLFMFGNSLGCDVEYVLPWPIEFEGRRLPKTGYYKASPFFGSEQVRRQLVCGIREFMTQNNINIVTPPTAWYTMNSEDYAKKHMEGSSSVHLSPQFYRRKQWGQIQ
jgi:hypothetical protein